MFTMTPVSDHTLFIYGGFGTYGNTLSESLMHLLLNEQNCLADG